MNRFTLAILLSLVLVVAAHAQSGATQSPRPLRPVHTFSIVARDPVTGDMGVAVQSHWFAVGAEVIWGEAGVGVVATQSFIDPSYGPLGLDLMRADKTAPEALRGLLAADPYADARQVAMLDAQGHVASHTGKHCIPAAGNQVGENYSAQANLMEKPTVWPAMGKAFESTQGDLIDRLLAALEAAQREGGDIRGKQSAAILVVRAKSTGRPWADKIVDLRVDDSADPINELKRLVRYHRAYEHMENGDACSTKKDWDCAVREYGDAEKILPDQMEIVFWHAVTLVTSGRTEESLPLFKRVFAREPIRAELLGRLPAAGLFPDDPKLIARIQAERPR
ncbi:MAG: DUF1028 domain-containing protein [Candidatus Acidiferrales bacterium]